MTLTFEATRQGYANLWAKMVVRADKVTAADAISQRIIKARSRYETIEKSTSVPWFLIGALHYRESDMDFDTYLGNGQSLHHVTTIVPAGRGPWDNFEAGAEDALALDGLDKIKDWPIERILYESESYNGLGYFSRGSNSPYLWSWSDQYTSGKFVRDGVFDSAAVDAQCGVSVLIKRLAAADASIAARIAGPPPAPPPPPPVTPSDVRAIVVAALRAIADEIEAAK